MSQGWRHSFWFREFKPLVWAVVVLIAVQLFEFHGWMASVEGKVLDIFQAYSPGSPAAVPPKVVVLEIDENAYKQWFGSSPLNPAHVLGLVDATLDLDPPPAVIGVDILTDPADPVNQKLYRDWSHGYSDRHPTKPTRVVWAMGEPAKADKLGFFAWSFDKIPKLAANKTDVLGDNTLDHLPRSFLWATPMFPRDEDLALRRYPRRINNVGLRPSAPSWASAVGEAYCESRGHCPPWAHGEPEEVILSFKGAPLEFNVFDVFQLAAGKLVLRDDPDKQDAGDKEGKEGNPRSLFAEFARNGVVLIGGAFNQSILNDYHDTPQGLMPGVKLNAYAVQAEIARSGARETWHPLLVLGDLIFGFLIVYFFADVDELRRPILYTLLLTAGVMILSWQLYRNQYVWLSWIGMFIGMWPHIVIEVLHKKVKVEKD
jgi:hypothetical protein